MEKKIPLSIVIILLFSIPAVALPIEQWISCFMGQCEIEKIKYEDVTSWDFSTHPKVVFRLAHHLPSGASVQENYYYSDVANPINARYYCKWNLFVNTCEIWLSHDANNTYAKVTDYSLLPATKEIFASYTIDLNQNYNFSLSVPRGFMYWGAALHIQELVDSPIYRVKGSSSQPIDMELEMINSGGYQASVQNTNEVLQDSENASIWDFFWGVWALAGIMVTVLFFFKLFIIDNPVLTLACIEVIILAHALLSKNMSRWWNTFIEDHSKIYNFIINVVSKFIEFIVNIINALKPV